MRLEMLEMAGEVGVKWIGRLLQEGRIPKEWRMGLILLYADDLALVANGKQETLEEWNGLFTRHGLKINVEKTEVLHIGHQRKELDIELDGKKLTQGDSFVYLGGAVCGDGKTENTGWSERVESS